MMVNFILLTLQTLVDPFLNVHVNSGPTVVEVGRSWVACIPGWAREYKNSNTR